jgi:hypothetical protein
MHHGRETAPGGAAMDEAKMLLRLKGAPIAFKALAAIADNTTHKDCAKARAQLKRQLPKLRALINDPELSPEDKRDLEAIRDKHSV